MWRAQLGRLWPLTITLLCLSVARPAASARGQLAYVSVRGGEASQAAASQAALLDHSEASRWCTAVRPGQPAPALIFSFLGRQRVDGLRLVVPGPLRPAAVRLSDGRRSVVLPLPDDGRLEAHLASPLRGTEMTLALCDAQGGQPSPMEQVCIAGVTLLAGDQQVSRVAPPSAVGNAGGQLLVGAWQRAPLGCASANVSFANNGTYHFVPAAGSAGSAQRGTYLRKGRRLFVRPEGASHYCRASVQRSRVQIDPTDMGAPQGDYDTLSIAGACAGPLAGSYNNARF